LIPEQTRSSPLDVPPIKATVSTGELVEIVRKERGRTRGWNDVCKTTCLARGVEAVEKVPTQILGQDAEKRF
jgi:hypothetical protein